MWVAVIGVLIVTGLIVTVLILEEIKKASWMPESWDDDTDEFIMCEECCWEGDHYTWGAPSLGCRVCPFYHPEQKRNGGSDK